MDRLEGVKNNEILGIKIIITYIRSGFAEEMAGKSLESSKTEVDATLREFARYLKNDKRDKRFEVLDDRIIITYLRIFQTSEGKSTEIELAKSIIEYLPEDFENIESIIKPLCNIKTQ
jgi:hypothetical protein